MHGRSPLLRLQSDERLVAMMRRGNHAAFEHLVGRYQSRLLAFCRHMLGSNEDAEDVLQDVFAAAFNAILADDRPINVRPWLYRIARNRSLNHLRRASAVGVDSMDVHFSDHGETAADQVHKREEFRLLVGDIRDLPETQRTALLLREMEALSYEQIAEAMETTIPGVKSLLVRARVSLAEAAEARQLTCSDVRLELGEVAEGLRRRTTPPVRRHLRSCDRCATFRKQLKETNRALAALLPVGPFVVLRKLFFSHLGHGAGASAGSHVTAAGSTAAGGTAAAAGSTAAAGGTAAAAGSTAAAAGGTAAAAAGSTIAAGSTATGLVSAGVTAVATKAAAGLAAAAIVTAGAVEVGQTNRHPQPLQGTPLAAAIVTQPTGAPKLAAGSARHQELKSIAPKQAAKGGAKSKAAATVPVAAKQPATTPLIPASTQGRTETTTVSTTLSSTGSAGTSPASPSVEVITTPRLTSTTPVATPTTGSCTAGPGATATVGGTSTTPGGTATTSPAGTATTPGTTGTTPGTTTTTTPATTTATSPAATTTPAPTPTCSAIGAAPGNSNPASAGTPAG
jgi:RNA polymerase sigma factor (sigma-70 family)